MHLWGRAISLGGWRYDNLNGWGKGMKDIGFGGQSTDRHV